MKSDSTPEVVALYDGVNRLSERQVSIGIRRTLWVQAQRLEYLARERLNELDEKTP